MGQKALRKFATVFALVAVSIAIAWFSKRIAFGGKAAVVGFAAAALIATSVLFLILRPLTPPGGRTSWLRFSGRLVLKLIGIYLVSIFWTGADYYVEHTQIQIQDLFLVLKLAMASVPYLLIVLFFYSWFAHRMRSRENGA